MSLRATMAVGALLVSCVGSSDGINSVEDCKAAGGRVAPNPGAGVECEDDEEQIGVLNEPVAFEPPICCRPKQ